MPWSWVNTGHRIHWVQHTPSTAYTEFSFHRVQLTPSRAYTEYSLHRVELTPSTAYTEYSLHRVQLTPSPAYTEYNLHCVQLTLSTAYTEFSLYRVQLKPSTTYTESSLHWVQLTPSTAYTEYRLHQVQLTPSTVSTQDCLSSLYFHDYELTHQCSFSFRCAFLQNRPPPARSQWELQDEVISLHSHGCELTNWWIESQHPEGLLSTAFKYSSNRARSWPQVHLETRSIMAFKCISELDDCGLQMNLWNSLDHGLQVHLQTCSITSSKHISVFNLISACRCIFKVAQLRPPSASPNLHYYGLPVHLQAYSIKASKYISMFKTSPPLSASLSSLDRHLQAHLQLLSSTGCSQSRYTVCRWEAI